MARTAQPASQAGRPGPTTPSVSRGDGEAPTQPAAASLGGGWHPATFHAGERRIKWIAFGVAIALHIIALLFNFPSITTSLAQKKPQQVIVVRKYIPPPPKVERKQVIKKKLARKVPIPDPTPDEPEPIREPDPEIEPDPLPDDVEILLGVPEPPPADAGGPLLAGVAGITNPVLIDKQRPNYPELARVARLEGTVILQAVVRRDGTVGELHVLRCTEPNMGFEEAAMDAVVQWLYEPATQDGRPVDVFFTVFVDFSLH